MIPMWSAFVFLLERVIKAKRQQTEIRLSWRFLWICAPCDTEWVRRRGSDDTKTKYNNFSLNISLCVYLSLVERAIRWTNGCLEIISSDASRGSSTSHKQVSQFLSLTHDDDGQPWLNVTFQDTFPSALTKWHFGKRKIADELVTDTPIITFLLLPLLPCSPVCISRNNHN